MSSHSPVGMVITALLLTSSPAMARPWPAELLQPAGSGPMSAPPPGGGGRSNEKSDFGAALAGTICGAVGVAACLGQPRSQGERTVRAWGAMTLGAVGLIAPSGSGTTTDRVRAASVASFGLGAAAMAMGYRMQRRPLRASAANVGFEASPLAATGAMARVTLRF
jgi:hypothetical protein